MFTTYRHGSAIVLVLKILRNYKDETQTGVLQWSFISAETNTFKLEHSRRREIALPVLILRWCIRSLLKNPICTSTCKFEGNISSKFNTAAPIEWTVNVLNCELNSFNFYLWQRVHSMQQFLEFQLKCSFNTEILRKSVLSTEDTGHDSWMYLFFNQDLRSHS